MVDVHSKEIRSFNMSCIRCAETKPEITVRKFLYSKGFRYRKNVKNLPGKPDIVLPKYKTVIFVHGCFWHGHTAKRCKLSNIPKSNTEFWKNKIQENIIRDKKSSETLKAQEWKVIIIWECNLKIKRKEKELLTVANKLLK